MSEGSAKIFSPDKDKDPNPDPKTQALDRFLSHSPDDRLLAQFKEQEIKHETKISELQEKIDNLRTTLSQVHYVNQQTLMEI